MWDTYSRLDPILSTLSPRELYDIINPVTGTDGQQIDIAGSSTGVVDGKAAWQVHQEAASVSGVKESDNQAVEVAEPNLIIKIVKEILHFTYQVCY